MIFSGIDVDIYNRGKNPVSGVVNIVITYVPGLVPASVVYIVVWVPVVVITVVVVPVDRSPGTPVGRVISPVPS